MPDTCVMCGAVIPEGAWVCWACEHDIMEGKPMDETNIELKLNDHEHEIGSLKHRMKAVEENQKALNSLATSVAVMVEKVDGIGEKVDGIDAKVSAIEQKPGKRWDGIVDKLLWLVIGAAIAALFAQGGVVV